VSEGIFQGQFFYTQVTGIELDGFSSGCQACVGSAFTHRAILWSNLWVGVSFSMVVFYLREWSFKIKKLKIKNYIALLNSSTIRIGHTGMETEHIVDNILAVSEMLSEKLPEVQYGKCMFSILKKQSVYK
jgi:hypothetical protein